MEIGKATLRRGEEVLPVLVTVDRKSRAQIIGLACMFPPGIDKGKLLRELADKAHAVALLFFADAYTLDDETHERNGEILSAHVETEDGRTYGLACRYTRNPFVFGAVESLEGTQWVTGPLISQKKRAVM